jgi:hypothetical protein
VSLLGAAGSGRSAGAGGARSTPASPTATLVELVQTAIAAFAPHDGCAKALSAAHLVPKLLRRMPVDPDGAGGLLRTLFSHSVVVEEMGSVGALVDLVLTFVGGPAAGPAPGKPGGPPLPGGAPLTVSLPVRRVAGALISLLCSDSAFGPPQYLSLTQLVPDGLAVAIKESVSAATTSSGVALGAAGSGVGAAGATGTGGGLLGDAVARFDGDHETPELIWDVTCRHELRVALAEMARGLAGLRTRLGPTTAGGGDGVRWALPATFRVRYSVAEGELRVGGVYVRVFLKEPTFPLRDPKGFLEACLFRFMQEATHLVGLTSDNPDELRRAQAAAHEEAKKEESVGGVRVLHKPRGGAGAAAAAASDDLAGGSGVSSQALVVRGEDVMTQVTHALVCLLRVRPTLADHVAAQGYVPKLLSALSQSLAQPARYNLGIQVVRLLQVVAVSKPCVVAMARNRAAAVLLRMAQPLPRDAAFVLEALRGVLETDSTDSHELVGQAVAGGAVDFLMTVMESADLTHLVDASAAKVHAVAILKVMEGDPVHGAAAAAALAAHARAWDRYRHQKHDLFLSKVDTRDYFLTDVENTPSLLLKNQPEFVGKGGAGGAASGAGGRPPAMGLLTDDTVPPPVAPPDVGMAGSSSGAATAFGGFQAPAPAPSAFGGFQAPAPAPVAPRSAASTAAVPAPAPAPAPAPVVRPAPAPAPVPLPAPAPAPAPVVRPAVARPAPAPATAGGDPFGDLLGLGGAASAPAPAPAVAAAPAGGMFAGMTVAPASRAPAPAPTRPAAAPAPAGGHDPFAGLD